jgi:uncharacterized protein (DUF2384 family)
MKTITQSKPKATVVKASKLTPTARPDHAESLVLEKAIEVIGDRHDAMRWMGTPVRALGYATPVSMLATANGMNAVLAVLSQLEHGVL